MIFVLEDGKLAEMGSPQVLLADASSRFAKLANNQGIYEITGR